MTALDDKLVPVAFALIERFGVAASLQKPKDGSYTPATRSISGSAPAPETLTISPPGRFSEMLIDGDNVRTDDLQAYVAGSGLTAAQIPEPCDQIVHAAKVYTIVSVKPLYSGEQVAAYQMQWRSTQV